MLVLIQTNLTLRLALLLNCIVISLVVWLGDVYAISGLVFFGAYLSFKITGQDISTPGVWLVLAVWLYHFSLPILVRLGYYDTEYHSEIVSVPVFVIIVIFIMVVFLDKDRSFSETFRGRDLYFISELYYFFTFLVLIYALGMSYLAEGDKTKAAVLGLARLQIFQAFFVVAYGGCLVWRLSGNRKIIAFFLINVCFSLFVAVATGERDIFAGVVVVSVLAFSIFFRIGAAKVFSFVAAGGGIFTLLHFFRNYFSLGAMYSEVERNIFIEFLAGEPLSAANNFNTMYGYISKNGYLGVDYFVNDFMSIFIFKSIYFFENSLNWFNNYFYEDLVSRGGGVGYSLIANIYSYQGVGWVYIFFAGITTCIIFLRRWAFRSPTALFFYLSCVPIVIYSLRGDISILFGLILRNVLPVLIIYLFVRRYLFGGFTERGLYERGH